MQLEICHLLDHALWLVAFKLTCSVCILLCWNVGWRLTSAPTLQCIGFIIPLMDAMYANYYTREVMIILIREFQTPDEEMKKIVLKVVAQCVGTEGVEPDYIRQVPSPRCFHPRWCPLQWRPLIDSTVHWPACLGLFPWPQAN